LVESGMIEMFDRVLVVDCDESAQIKRVVKRDSCSENEARAIIQTQVSRNKRLAFATDVIDNSGDIRLLNAQIQRLHLHFLNLLEQKK
ncbi:MAG: dephospho-CoA kinase, partial [Pseudomonadota bacterium]